MAHSASRRGTNAGSRYSFRPSRTDEWFDMWLHIIDALDPRTFWAERESLFFASCPLQQT